jgi:hypothetical protein
MSISLPQMKEQQGTASVYREDNNKDVEEFEISGNEEDTNQPRSWQY